MEHANTSVREAAGELTGLVRLATASDDVGELLASAWTALGRPMAVIDGRGTPLASVPRGETGMAALAAALDGGHGAHGVRLDRWLVLPLQVGRERLGHLAVHATPALEGESWVVVDVLRSLVCDQLRRARLAGELRRERAAELKRRLVTDPGLSPSAARAAAQLAGIRLSPCYWPAIVVWEGRALDPVALSGIDDLVLQHDPASLAVQLRETTLVLLLGERVPGRSRARETRSIVGRVVRFAGGCLPSMGVHGILADASVPLSGIPAEVRALDRMRRYREPARDAGRLLEARQFALDRLLLEGLERRRAVEFVRTHAGALLAYDREHGTSLADTLEMVLDFPHRDDAARASYMHRNTLRRRLHHALELVDADLDDPSERLALHIALKLRRLLAAGTGETGGADAP